MYHHTLAITSHFNDTDVLYNRRGMQVGRSLYKMAKIFWTMNVLIILISCLCSTDGANTLGSFPMPAKSHVMVHSALMKEMACRRHQVTVFSSIPEKYTFQNFTDTEFKLSYSEFLQNSGE
jgi:hypothetical protein